MDPLWQTSGTVLEYRNVVISNCKLDQLAQFAVMDDSGTDLVKHKFTISVTGIVHSDDLIGLGVFTNEAGGLDLPDPDDAQQIIIRIQSWLMRPRFRLRLLNEGHLLLDAKGLHDLGVASAGSPTPGRRIKVNVGKFGINSETGVETQTATEDQVEMEDFDVSNGPKPISCNVSKVTGFKTYQVQYTIETCLAYYDSGILEIGDQPNPDLVGTKAKRNFAVLSNRWSLTESRDSNFAVQRILAGKLVVRSYTDYAHAFRYLCVPKLARGYQRVKMDFTQSPDGLTLTYMIVDQQRYAAPPFPAIDWKATHTEDVHQYGNITYGTISIWLRGAFRTPKSKLFSAAIAVIEHRLGDIRAQFVTGHLIPQHFTLTDNLSEPEIQVTVVVKRVVDEGHFGNKIHAGIVFGHLGKLPAVNAALANPEVGETLNNLARNDQVTSQHNRDKWPNALPYDTNSPVGLFVAYLQDPCLPWHGVPDPAETDNQGEGELTLSYTASAPSISVFEGENAAVVEYETLPAQSKLSLAHKEFAYTHYELESKYVTSEGVQALPLAKWYPPPVNPSEPKPPQVAIARVRNPVTYRDVWVRGFRVDARPEIPTSPETTTDSNGIQEFLYQSTIVEVPPQLLANGQQSEFEVEAHFRYLLSRTPTADEKLRVGKIPWDTTTKEENAVVLASTQNAAII